MKFFQLAVIATLCLFASILPVLAQDVTLTSRDGKVSIEGSLLSFDGEFYRIKSSYGAMTLEQSAVTCAGSGCPDLQAFVAEIRLAGAAPLGGVLLPALIADFAQQSAMIVEREIHDDTNFSYLLRLADSAKPVLRLTFNISNTDDGFASLISGKSDMAMTMREISSGEIQIAKEAKLGNLKDTARSRIIALDAVVPVVAHLNPVHKISLGQLADIFSGKIENWQQIGGPNAKIILHMPEENSGLAQQFKKLVMQQYRLVPATNTIRHDNAADLVDAVSIDPFAIGISRLSEIGSTKMLAINGACGMDFYATPHSVKSKDYPLSTPLFIYTTARRLPKSAREFLNHLRTASAQHIISQAGFVNQNVDQVSISQQGRRFANAITAAGDETSLDELQRMINTLQPAQRLTITFRFEAGSAKLDAQSQSNVVLLARLLEGGVYSGRELMFVGFSDGKGDAAINRRIAKRRAARVKTAVMKAADTLPRNQVAFAVEAFGEAMPMACDDTDWGREANRRVEVWLR